MQYHCCVSLLWVFIYGTHVARAVFTAFTICKKRAEVKDAVAGKRASSLQSVTTVVLSSVFEARLDCFIVLSIFFFHVGGHDLT